MSVVQCRVDDAMLLLKCTGLCGELSTYIPSHISTGDDHEVVSIDSTSSGPSAVVFLLRRFLLKSTSDFFSRIFVFC